MAVPTFIGATSGSISTGALTTQAWVAGHAVDDIGLCIMGSTDNTTGGHTTPSGFTAETASPSGWSTGTSTTSVLSEVWYKRATSTSEANAMGGTDIGTQYGKHLLVRGCKTSGDPVNVAASGVIASASTSISIVTGLTTTQNDSLIVLVVVLDADTGVPDAGFITANTNGNLTNIVKQNSNQWNTGAGVGLHIFTGELVTAGAVGTWSLTCGSSSTVAWWCGAMESANPSGGGGGPTLAGRISLLGVGI